MIIKILLLCLLYLFIGWLVDRFMTDPYNPEGLHMTIIVMFTWPFIALGVIYFMIIDAIMNVVDWILERVKKRIAYYKKKKSDKNKCKTCLYNKSASSRPVCLECDNYSLYEPEDVRDV